MTEGIGGAMTGNPMRLKPFAACVALLILSSHLASAPPAQRVPGAAPAPEVPQRQTSPALVERVLDFGERTFPHYFPGRPSTEYAAPFRYRYYGETGVYLGVATTAASGYPMNGVYVMGGPFGTQPLFVGTATDFVTLCAEPQSDPLSGALLTCHDIDGDGVVETEVTYARGLLSLRGAITRDIALTMPAGWTLRQIVAIGNHVGGPLSEIALRFDDQTGGSNETTVVVVDPESAGVVARSAQPLRTDYPVTTVYPLMADGRRIPVVAPPEERSVKRWDHVCKFSPAAQDPVCGNGFAKVAARPPSRFVSYLHHGVGWVQDVDGDGSEDLHLKFYAVKDGQRADGGVLSLSLVGDRSFWTSINIAEMSSDAEALFGVKAMPPWNGLAALNAQDFDLGRMRGTSSSFQASGRNKVLLVGGRHIGAFPTSTTDVSQAPLVMCNVTRYVGMLDSAPGAPGDLRMEWGWYFGYYQNAIENLPHILLGDGALVKRGSMAHGCIHRYDDSRLTSVEGRAAVAFSVFRVSSPDTQRTCEAEQRADYKARSAASNEAFLACVISTSGTVGRWTLQVLDERTGASAVAAADTYLWGFSNEILPGGRTVLLVEKLNRPVPFNRLGVSEPQIHLLQLESTPTWAFTELGALPIQGAPYTQERGYDVAPPPFAQYKSGPNSRLVVRRNAQAKGLMDFQLVNGKWIGYSPAEGRLVTK